MSEAIVESSFFKITKYPSTNVFERLPGLQGVQALTKYEIRKDLRDIERSFFVDDTDSDSSVKSEDILNSTYPVKPRKTHRLSLRSAVRDRQLLDVDNDRATIAAADESLNFLRAIKVSKADLYNAEVERERLEALQMSYESSIAEKTATFNSNKKEQENYIQLLQGLYVNYLHQNAAYSHQNTMIFDILEATQKRRQAADILDAESKKLKSILQGKSSKASSSTKCQEGETALLRVRLQKSNRDVTLFKGQWIKTPMGLGQVICIQPADHRVTFQLPFGKMYSYLERVVCWGGLNDRLDATSDRALYTAWNSKKSINMPISKRIGLRKLLGRVEETTDGSTDRDDDSSSEMAGQPDAASSSSSAEDNVAMQLLQTVLSQDTKAMEAASGEIVETDADIVLSDKLLASVGLDFMNGGKKIFPLPTGSHSNQSEDSGRQKIRRSLYDDVLTNAVDLKTLPIAFAPPASLPEIIDSIENPKLEAKVVYCKQALQGSDSGKLGSTGSLAWTGSVEDMSKTLQISNKGISRLESEVKDYMRKAQANNSQSLRMVKEISAIRLAMFTKRIRHRNNLGNFTSHFTLAPAGASATAAGSIVKDEIIKKESVDKSISPVKDVEIGGQTSKKRSRESEGGPKKGESRSRVSDVNDNSDKKAKMSTLDTSLSQESSVQDPEPEVEQDGKAKKSGNKRAKK